MSKKLLVMLIAGIVIVSAGLAIAAVEVKNNSTKISTTETLNYTTGLSATASGTDVNVAVSNIPTSGINWADLKTVAAAQGVNWADVTGL